MQFFIVILLNIILSTCISIVIPVMPVLLQGYNFASSGLSFPFFAIVLGRVLSRTFCVNIVGKFQYKIAIIFAFVLYVLVFTAYVFIRQPWALVLLRLFEGLVEGLVILALTDIVIMLSHNKKRGFYMGIFGASFGIGAIVGSFYSGFVLGKFGMNGIFVSNIVLSLCGVCLSQCLREYYLAKEEKLKITKELFSTISLYSASILRRVYFFAFTIFLPIYCVQILQMDLKSVANVFGVMACILVFFGPLGGRIADKMNVNKIVVLCIGVMSFCSLMLFLGFNFNVFFGLMLVFFGITMPVNMKLFCDVIEGHPNRTQVLGIASSIAEVLMLFVAVCVPFFMSFGVQFAWLFLAVCGVFAIIPYISKKQGF